MTWLERHPRLGPAALAEWRPDGLPVISHLLLADGSVASLPGDPPECVCAAARAALEGHHGLA